MLVGMEKAAPAEVSKVPLAQVRIAVNRYIVRHKLIDACLGEPG